MPDSAAQNDQALGPQQFGFQLRTRSVPADPASSRDDTVIGQTWDPRETHDVAYGASGPRTAGHHGHIAIGRHSAGWDALQNAQHSLSEYGGRCGTVHGQRRWTR